MPATPSQKLSIVTCNSVPDTRCQSAAPVRQVRRPSVPQQPRPIPPVPASQKYVHPKPYTTVNGYQLLQTIGQGSMGKVKLGRHVTTGQRVAVKVIPRFPDEIMQKVAHAYRKRKLAAANRHNSHGNSQQPAPITPPPIDLEYDAQRELRILREAFTLHLLDHPNIVRLLEFVIAADHYYMIFEYVPGTQLLDHVVQRGRMPANRVRQALGQLLDAVDYCHSRSLVHRDLKIENIMMEEVGPDELRIKLIDFGLGNFYRRDSLLSTFCGSLYFAAPELLQAKPYTGPHVDMWSIGVIAYVLLCGTVPFDDTNLATLHAKIKQGQVHYPAHLTAGARDFLGRLLCVNQRQRATMAEIRAHPWLLSDGAASAMASPLPAPLPHQQSAVSSLAPSLPFMPQQSHKQQQLVAAAVAHQQPDLAAWQSLAQSQTRGAVHPHPRIVDLLKRSPFQAASFDFPATPSTVSLTRRDGSVAVQAGPDTTKHVTLASVTECGFGGGFGYAVQEVDSVLRAVLLSSSSSTSSSSSAKLATHPVMTLYRMIWEAMVREGSITVAPVVVPQPMPVPMPMLMDDVVMEDTATAHNVGVC